MMADTSNIKRLTIWDALAERLGRQPTNAEASDEVKRILREAWGGQS